MFVGREPQIAEIDRYLKQVRAGRQQNVFMIGDRGLGKTSLASFIVQYAESRYNLLGVHAFLGGIGSLDDVVKKVFDELLKRVEKETWAQKVRGLFGKNIEEVGLFGISVKFNPPADKLSALRKDFPQAITHFQRLIREEKQGMVIVLDDINGTLDNEGFANWFKSMTDKVAVSNPDFPVLFVLIGLPEKRDQLFAQQPSLMRIFQIMEIERLHDDEVSSFYTRAFADANIQVSQGALNSMIASASGLPILMQEIGDAVFWADRDGFVDEIDVLQGILDASERIGKKYLDPTFFNAVRSPRYRSIIRKIGKLLKPDFTKSEVEAELSAEEKRVLSNFIQKMRHLGIISPDHEAPRGHYRFVNRLNPVYLHLEANRR
jgi:hypothetical protein